MRHGEVHAALRSASPRREPRAATASNGMSRRRALHIVAEESLTRAREEPGDIVPERLELPVRGEELRDVLGEHPLPGGHIEGAMKFEQARRGSPRGLRPARVAS